MLGLNSMTCLSYRQKYFLIEHSRTKLETASLTINEKLSSLKICFENYVCATVCELQSFYLKPILQVIEQTPTLANLIDYGECKDLTQLSECNQAAGLKDIYNFFDL